MLHHFIKWFGWLGLTKNTKEDRVRKPILIGDLVQSIYIQHGGPIVFKSISIKGSYAYLGQPGERFKEVGILVGKSPRTALGSVMNYVLTPSSVGWIHQNDLKTVEE
jgi:hypothetical protein